MTTNDYLALNKRTQLMTNGLMLLLGASLTIIVSLLFFMNQNPASAMKPDTAVSDEGSYALYAAAYAKGMAAAQTSSAPEARSMGCSEPTATATETAAPASVGGSGAMMPKADWTAAVRQSYNTYNTTAQYTTNTDNSTNTVTNNTSSSTVNVTNSNGATVSSNSATNGQVSSNTQTTQLGSNNTTNSFNQETTNNTTNSNNIATTSNNVDTTTNVTTNLVNNSYNDESIRSTTDTSLIEAPVRL